MEHFQYLGSVISEGGSLDTEIGRRLGNASKAFGALKRAVFNVKVLTISTKRLIYQACVLSVHLYGCECWIPLRRHVKRLESFHHRCARAVLGISNKQQWEQHISAEEVRDRWGDKESISTKLRKRRLEWLGHLSRMSEDCMPKKILFSWLARPRPCCGPRKRLRDVVKDLQAAGISTQLVIKGGARQEAVAQEIQHRSSEPSTITEGQRGGMKTRVWSALVVEGCSEGKQTRLGTSVRRREKNQFASREVLYSVQFVNNGLRVEEVSQFVAVNLAQVHDEVLSVSVPDAQV